MLEVSLWEEHRHHGGGLVPVQVPPTIPKKGVEEGPVLWLPITGGQLIVDSMQYREGDICGTHTPTLGPRAKCLTPGTQNSRAGAHTTMPGAGL